MKVLHVLHELKPSGAEVMLFNSYPLWREHGVEPEILATAAERGVYGDALRDAGYPVHHLPYGRDFGFFLRFYKFLKAQRIEVVHQHVEGSGFWFGLTALLAGCRVLRISHNNFLFDGFLRTRRAFQRRLLSWLGVTFVACAQGVRDNERARFGIDPVVVWNWADVTRFTAPAAHQRAAARARWGFAESDIVVLSIGNCSHVKNHAALLGALKDERLVRFRYLHVGVEDHGHSEKAQAASAGLQDRVVFVGWVADALPALHAADLYAMPSLFEGLAIAAIEALATGLPALFADVAGLRDFKPMFPGIIWVAPEADSVRQGLQRFAELSGTERKALSASYPAIALRAFSPERGVAEYVALYRARPAAVAGLPA